MSMSTRCRPSASCSTISRGIAITGHTCSTRMTIRSATRCGRCMNARCGASAQCRRWSSGTTISRSSRSWRGLRIARAPPSRRRRTRRIVSHLKKLESLLYRLITAPSGVAEGLAAERALDAGGLDDIVLGDERLSAEARVDIYANMYFYRLLDALKEDFPATLAVLGDDNFHNLVTGYLLEYPPTEPSLYYCGQHLAAYLRDHPMREGAPFVADLAAVERAVVKVFHGPDAAALETDSLRAIAPADWPALKFDLQPSAQILALDWRVSELLRAVEERRDWTPADRGSHRILVWRRDTRVLYRELDQAEADALAAVSRGATFAEICEVVAVDGGDQDPVAAMNRMLARWLADGLLVG